MPIYFDRHALARENMKAESAHRGKLEAAREAVGRAAAVEEDLQRLLRNSLASRGAREDARRDGIESGALTLPQATFTARGTSDPAPPAPLSPKLAGKDPPETVPAPVTAGKSAAAGSAIPASPGRSDNVSPCSSHGPAAVSMVGGAWLAEAPNQAEEGLHARAERAKYLVHTYGLSIADAITCVIQDDQAAARASSGVATRLTKTPRSATEAAHTARTARNLVLGGGAASV